MSPCSEVGVARGRGQLACNPGLTCVGRGALTGTAHGAQFGGWKHASLLLQATKLILNWGQKLELRTSALCRRHFPQVGIRSQV